MEPCQYCGQLAAVDGAGFCTNCRNYRGVPAAPVSGPGYPTTGAPYPTTGAPYPTTGVPYPTSGPSYGQQPSAPPYGPVSGGGFPQQAPYQPTAYPAPAPTTAYPAAAPVTAYQGPGYAPAPAPEPPKRRSPYLVPIVAVSSVVVVLAVAIIAVLAFSGGGKPKPKPPATQAANGFDQCMVGNWKITQYTARISLDTVGDVLFTAVSLNETLQIKPDGTTLDDYGTATKPSTLRGTSGTHTYQLNIYGTANYLLKSANHVLSFENVTTNGKINVVIDGKDNGTVDLTVDNDPTPYTCGGSSFTQTTSRFTASGSKTG